MGKRGFEEKQSPSSFKLERKVDDQRGPLLKSSPCDDQFFLVQRAAGWARRGYVTARQCGLE